MKQFLLMLCVIISLVPLAEAREASKRHAMYLYRLSDFYGTISYSQAPVVCDDERQEIYVLYQGTINIFNSSGMKVYSFSAVGSDEEDRARAVAVLPGGDILILTYTVTGYQIIRRNYRGVPAGRVELKDLPPNLSVFNPDRMVYKGGLLYFADSFGMVIVVTSADGHYKSHYDLLPMLDTKEKGEGDIEMSGFNVDRKGNMLFTSSVLFSAYVLSPSGKLSSFGGGGNLPGKFNIVAGIASDSYGNYFVVDQLKRTVQVFDENFKFLFQFGGRGLQAEGLRMPDNIAVSRDNLVYVSNSVGGISVFRPLY